jgi:predicted membrane protein
MNQRTIALVIVGAIVLFLLVAAVVAGLVIGGVIGALTDRQGGLQVRTEQPQSIDELRDTYRLETGSLEVNLEDVDLPEETTDLEASVENGALRVVVPRGVAVSSHAEVGEGALSILGSAQSGENLDRDYESEGYDQAERRLSLDLSAGTGVITVVRQE